MKLDQGNSFSSMLRFPVNPSSLSFHLEKNVQWEKQQYPISQQQSVIHLLAELSETPTIDVDPSDYGGNNQNQESHQKKRKEKRAGATEQAKHKEGATDNLHPWQD